jgi:aryl-alcohol dehydrogenase-like predicted oxidoreductase
MKKRKLAGVLAVWRELGIGFVAYFPLGRGFLSDRITSPPHDT